MTTPLIILGILLAPLLGAYALAQMRAGVDPRIGGVIGLSLAFVFFGVGHFVQTQAMAEMLPPWVPGRIAIIYATGTLEWLLAIGLMFPRIRTHVGWACIGVLMLFFPANIYAAMKSVGTGGHLWGPIYLLIRAPLQLILIAWTYWFAVRDVRRPRPR